MNRIKSKSMNRINNILIIVFMSLSFSKSGFGQDDSRIIIGEKVAFNSKILEKEIQLSVHNPDDYENSNERYPVLYTFQTHFEQVSGAVKNLYDYGLIPKMILIRIDNYEFGYLTPTKVENNPNSGKADLFLQFFKDELFQFIDSVYRTHPYRIVFSNSWGAMFAVYAILAKPEIFDAAIASIPWIMYDGDSRFMINNAEEFLNNNVYNNSLYMTMDNESEILHDLEIFLEVLRKKPKQGLEWEYQYWPEEDHTSTPYRSIYAGLRSIYAGWNQIPLDISFLGLAEIKKYESSLNQKFGYDIGVSAFALRKAGQEQKSNNNFEKAILIFNYAIEKNPVDAMAYVTLGRAYEENNMILLAKNAFEKAYDIAVNSFHPQVKWIKNFLDRILEKTRDVEN